MDTATPPRQSLASTMEITSQRRSSISSQVRQTFSKYSNLGLFNYHLSFSSLSVYELSDDRPECNSWHDDSAATAAATTAAAASDKRTGERDVTIHSVGFIV